jgi:hypothetical protein
MTTELYKKKIRQKEIIEEKQLKKENKPRYKKIFGDIKKCVVCGFPIAPREEKEHLIFHHSYLNSKLKIKRENNFDLLLTFEQNEALTEWVENNKVIVLKGEKDLNFMSQLLGRMIWLEFNSYHSFRGYNTKKNTNFIEFMSSLFNKEHFKEEIESVFKDSLDEILEMNYEGLFFVGEKGKI